MTTHGWGKTIMLTVIGMLIGAAGLTLARVASPSFDLKWKIKVSPSSVGYDPAQSWAYNCIVLDEYVKLDFPVTDKVIADLRKIVETEKDPIVVATARSMLDSYRMVGSFHATQTWQNKLRDDEAKAAKQRAIDAWKGNK